MPSLWSPARRVAVTDARTSNGPDVPPLEAEGTLAWQRVDLSGIGRGFREQSIGVEIIKIVEDAVE